jgi:hypothetical protein
MRDEMLPRFSKEQMPAPVPDTETPGAPEQRPAPTTPAAGTATARPAAAAERP